MVWLLAAGPVAAEPLHGHARASFIRSSVKTCVAASLQDYAANTALLRGLGVNPDNYEAYCQCGAAYAADHLSAEDAVTVTRTGLPTQSAMILLDDAVPICMRVLIDPG